MVRQYPTVRVGPLDVADLSYDQVVDRIVDAAASTAVPWIANCLHVSAIMEFGRPAYVAAIESCDLAYADGTSVALLAHLAGARRLERAPLTDMAHDVLDRLSRTRACRVALIGGTAGVADKAAAILRSRHGADVVMTDHGYHHDWQRTLQRLNECEPDVVFVGMGTPLEQEWLARHRDSLPAAVYLGSGGWFGHVMGTESRAPGWMRRVGLEWVWRMVQQPRHLAPRYARGAVAFVTLAGRIVLSRVRR